MKKTITAQEFVGIFESDGNISFYLQVVSAKTGGFKMSVNLNFIISQAKANIDLLDEVKRFAGGGTIKTRRARPNTNEQEGGQLIINAQSEEGKKILQVFKDYPLKLKRVARDLEVLKAIIAVRGNNRVLTARQKAMILLLSYQNSSQIQPNSTVIKKRPIFELKDKLALTKTDFKDGWAEIKRDYLPKIIEAEIVTKQKISDEYFRGFFIGDGELGISYQSSATSCTPTFKFTITDSDKEFLLSIKEKLGCGQVEKEQNNAFQFRIQSKEQIAEKIFPILSDGYLPSGRQKAFDIFKEAYLMSLTDDIKTKDGWERFVELTYALNLEGSRRKKTIEEFISLGDILENNED